MNEIEEKLPISYFKNKWYVREDFYPEQFDIEERHVENCNIMYQSGNCFDSKEKALNACHAVRKLFLTFQDE